jgi:7-cyano-7-deazaguanine synthase
MEYEDMTSAVVLLSGGQDSTTCIYWAKQQFDSLFAVGFDYGQMHVQELECATTIAGRLGVPYRVFNVRDVLATVLM